MRDPVTQTYALSVADVLGICEAARDQANRTIDERTPVGAYIRELERSIQELECSVAELREQVEDWRRRYLIAVDERKRAEVAAGIVQLGPGPLRGAITLVDGPFDRGGNVVEIARIGAIAL